MERPNQNEASRRSTRTSGITPVAVPISSATASPAAPTAAAARSLTANADRRLPEPANASRGAPPPSAVQIARKNLSAGLSDMQGA